MKNVRHIHVKEIETLSETVGIPKEINWSRD